MSAAFSTETRFSWLKSKTSIVASLIILVVVCGGLYQIWQQNVGVNSEIRTLRDELALLETNNVELSELIDYLNSTAYIEAKARRDLGLKKEGEGAVIIPDVTEMVIRSNQQDSDPNRSNIKKWWDYFFSTNDNTSS
ncbi:MAG: hypothetical protein A2840_02860 [Candidatus Buchananbacteria bacterium RIFCSPHIGHO2_01_FULL_47_11b]|uniref:Cell division protein FtsL n=1 Tax=Candidatus Buchananbacteria bacterium RIFCSPHIGHO2_01_FULL_47_11b TaxID=1797537 RepID=A0A1G1Y2S8_9BACT|nr:MAG: hypothetical protein A2840_02860 [Candidatus Buchananbacteria bacterium RIFCSPHIGHO2_01_FULL_47_11b]